MTAKIVKTSDTGVTLELAAGTMAIRCANRTSFYFGTKDSEGEWVYRWIPRTEAMELANFILKEGEV